MVRVLFLHPDLGIGGAERLVVDAALALKGKGHSVSFITNHHDPEHCFEETRDGTFQVQTVCDPERFSVGSMHFVHISEWFALHFTLRLLYHDENVSM